MKPTLPPVVVSIFLVTLLAPAVLAAVPDRLADRPRKTIPLPDGAKRVPASIQGEAAAARPEKRGRHRSIRQAFEAAGYGIRRDENRPGVAWARNSQQRISSRFDETGLHLTVRSPASKIYTSNWRLVSMGYGDDQVLVPSGILRGEGQRAEIARPESGLTEWFVNRPSGLEHGFTLKTRPVGHSAKSEHPLTLRVSVSGDLVPAACDHARGLKLLDPASGKTVLGYDRLVVWDADGRALEAEIRVTPERGVIFDVDDADARYPITIDPTFTQQAYLKASNAGDDDDFGTSVGISGDIAVVGAPFEAGDAASTAEMPNDNLGNSGAAYVFERDAGGNWIQRAYLKASNPGLADRFGEAVAIDGDTLVVGAYWESGDSASTVGMPNNNAFRAGAAYVFVRDLAGDWNQQAYLKASNAGVEDEFGKSVAISGDTIIIGAALEDGDATSTEGMPNDDADEAGAAYVFVRDGGGNWTQQAYLKANDAQMDDEFGAAVAISDDTAVIGAENENTGAVRAGAAYVFVRDGGGNWTQQERLKASDPSGTDLFGAVVAVSGDVAAIGTRLDDGDENSVLGMINDNASQAGAVYVFERDAQDDWNLTAYLKASNVDSGDLFGASVAMSGERIVVGATFEEGDSASTAAAPNNNSNDAGAAYVFGRNAGGDWVQENYLKASNAGAEDRFGTSGVAISGDTVIVGSPEEDGDQTSTAEAPNDDGDSTGAAYVFQQVAPADPALAAKKARLKRKIARLKRKIRRLKKVGQKRKANQLNRKRNRLIRELRKL